MREAARVCNYCGSPIATIRCGQCFTMNVLEAQHCISCGAELGLMPVPVENAAGCACPRCKNRELDGFAALDGTIFDCGKCGGQFVAGDVLSAMIRRHESVGLEMPRRLRAGNPIKEPVTYIPCPFCRDLMLRHNFGKVSGIVVDACAKHGTWFDVGELARVLSFVTLGGLKKASEVQAEEQPRLSSGSLDSKAYDTWRAVNLDEPPSAMNGRVALQQAVESFVAWVRRYF